MQSPDFKHMLGRLLGPAKAEIGCDECFEQLDRYVDLEVAGHDADAALPGLRTLKGAQTRFHAAKLYCGVVRRVGLGARHGLWASAEFAADEPGDWEA